MTESQFIRFLSDIYVTSKGNHLSASSIDKYSRQVTKKLDQYIVRLMPDSGYKSIYEINTLAELEDFEKCLNGDESYNKDNKSGNNMYSAGLHRYIEFAKGESISVFTDDSSFMDEKEPVPKFISAKPREVVFRDSVKIAQAKGACRYCCQLDSGHRTFTAAANMKQFVEGHHIIPISCQRDFNYSLDVLSNIIVLCPNCHRLLHYAVKQDREDRLKRIYDQRYERFENSGILVDRQSFIEYATEGFLKNSV